MKNYYIKDGKNEKFLFFSNKCSVGITKSDTIIIHSEELDITFYLPLEKLDKQTKEALKGVKRMKRRIDKIISPIERIK